MGLLGAVVQWVGKSYPAGKREGDFQSATLFRPYPDLGQAGQASEAPGTQPVCTRRWREGPPPG